MRSTSANSALRGQQPVGQRLDRAAALAAELEAPQRPGQLSRARRARATRGRRTRAAGPPPRPSAGSRRRGGAGRWRAEPPSTLEPSVRAQAVGPSAGSASSHRRSAVCRRRRRRPAFSSARPSPRELSSASTATVACGSSASPAGASASVVARTSASPSPSGTSSDSITRPSTEREHDRELAAAVGDLLELGVGDAEALGVEDEVGGVAPDGAEEGLQRAVGQGARVAGGHAAAAPAQVAGQVGQLREAAGGGRIGGQAGEHPDPLGDEAPGQRACSSTAAPSGSAWRRARTGSRRRRTPPRPAARRPPPRRPRVSHAAPGCACAADSLQAQRPPACCKISVRRVCYAATGYGLRASAQEPCAPSHSVP